MRTNKLFQEYTARFAAASIQYLINEFNRQVGHNAWTSARAIHDQALIAEMQYRGIDVSSVFDGQTINFSKHVFLKSSFKISIVSN